MSGLSARLLSLLIILLASAPAAARPSVGRLLKLLPKTQGDGQLRLIRDLGLSGKPKAAVPPLLALLDVRQDSPRRSAVIVEALGRLGDRKAAETLLGAWDYLVGLRQQMDLTAQVQVLRLAVVEALGRVGGEAAGRALMEALSDPNPAVAQAAVRALGTMRERKSVEALAELAGRGGDLGQAACEALGAVGDARGRPALERLLKAENALQAAPAAYGLARLGRKEGVRALEGMLESSLTGDPAARLAAYYLAKLDRSSGLDFLVQLLEAEGGNLQISAAEILGKAGNRRAVLPLTEAIHAAEPALRLVIAHSLGQLGGARAVLTLKKLKDDDHLAVRAAAAAALAELGED
ncbi:MAG: HEAT repeat domain-containing protein [Elusimicrobia bacterium]|nr:HEAT repeat domain-containing protein [Elusimicrobiota bacterium]